jgi:hypothetical protein
MQKNKAKHDAKYTCRLHPNMIFVIEVHFLFTSYIPFQDDPKYTNHLYY